MNNMYPTLVLKSQKLEKNLESFVHTGSKIILNHLHLKISYLFILRQKRKYSLLELREDRRENTVC